MFTLKITQLQLPHSCALLAKYSHFALKILQSIKRNSNITTKYQIKGCGLLSYGKSSSWHFRGMYWLQNIRNCHQMTVTRVRRSEREHWNLHKPQFTFTITSETLSSCDRTFLNRKWQNSWQTNHTHNSAHWLNYTRFHILRWWVWHHVVSQNISMCFWWMYCLHTGTHSGTAGWGTALQARRSRGRFPKVSLKFLLT